MDGKQLKNSILQWAIQGKLVPQNPKDEPASVLLAKIRKEKEALVKQGKLKKKDLESSPIDEEEIPFEIPETWTWCRMGDFITISTGLAYKKEDLDVRAKSYIRVLRGGNIDYGKWFLKDDDVLIAPQFVKDDLILKKGTFITPAVTSLEQMGKTALIESDQKDVVVGGFVLMLSPIYNDEIFLKYILNVFQSYYYKQYCQSITNKSGQAFYNLSRQKLLQCLIPLPPLAEQKRIVAKLEQVLPLAEEYGVAQEQLDKLNKELPEALKKSILQEAIQGKLVPQNPKDEPASKLLEKISLSRHSERSEESSKGSKKASLRGAKATKQSKNASSRIYRENGVWYEQIGSATSKDISDEIPFEIPENWAWCRLKNIVFNHGQKIPTETFSYIDIGSIDNKRQKLNDKENIIQASAAPSRARKIVKIDDILYSTVRPYLHNMCIIDREFSKEPIASTGFAVLACNECVVVKFLFYYLLSPKFDDYANDGDNAKGIAYPAINDEKLYKALIPLPPLAEQKRIVAKLEQLFKVL